MSFIVVLGAPVGSLILTPAALPYLRALFYFLAVAQFLLFGILKIGADVTVWIIIVCITVLVFAALLGHYTFALKRSGAEVEDAQGVVAATRSSSPPSTAATSSPSTASEGSSPHLMLGELESKC